MDDASMTRRNFSQLAAAGLPLLADTSSAPPEPWKILLVVAHPDDEYYFAATVYRLAQELGATVDQAIITNGEGGFRYSTLAEKYYGLHLTDEQTGRIRLPEIRRRETLAAGKVLGIRHHYFLDQRDQRFTLAAGDAFDQGWNHDRIRQTLARLMAECEYDFVFTVLPRASTHGHHQAATLLAIEAVKQLPDAQRPAILGAEPGRSCDLVPFTGLNGFQDARAAGAEPVLTFERTRSFGFQSALRYEIVVHWVISEHKSQGMFQNDVGRHDVERFWLLAEGPPGARERALRLAHDVTRTESVGRCGLFPDPN
jgi:LmbE family N-acetylglucosaminyl deacetylase